MITVTGASRGYAFVEFVDERGFRAAFAGLHRAVLEDSTFMADYERERVMQGWASEGELVLAALMSLCLLFLLHAGWKPRQLGGWLLVRRTRLLLF